MSAGPFPHLPSRREPLGIGDRLATHRRTRQQRSTDPVDRGIFDILARRREAEAGGDFPDLSAARARVDELRCSMDLAGLRAAAIDEIVALTDLVCRLPSPGDRQLEVLDQ